MTDTLLKPVRIAGNDILATINGLTHVIHLSPEVLEMKVTDFLDFLIGDVNRAIDRVTRLEANLVTPRTAAKLIQTSTKTLRRWAKSGKISYILTMGKHRRYLLSELTKLEKTV
jgi:excisionase family DNA binding protein